ncbi:MAG: PEP-CTERM sorting domain-containing protein [Opitutaceae bacterium]|nr:PEP-CTERM sorting domain-containing protein [Opitutaceae bacterium]
MVVYHQGFHAQVRLCIGIHQAIALFALSLLAAGFLRVEAKNIIPDAGVSDIWSNQPGWLNKNVPGGSDTPQISSNGTLTVDGNYPVDSINLFNGTLNGPGTLTITSTGSEWRGTVLIFSSGGGITIASGADFLISTTANHDFNSTLIENAGTVNWEVGAGPLRSGNGGAFTNNGLFNDAAAGTSTATVDVNNAFNGTACVFTNSAGAIYRKTSPGTTTMSTSFVNNGQLDLQAGTLALLATSTFNAGATQTGSGLLKLVSGTLTANGAMAFSNFQIAGGTITGNHTFNGTIEWTNGNFNSSASTTTLGGTLTIDSAADHDFDTHAFVNNGTVYWVAGAGPLRSGNSGTFTNNATFNDAASAGWNNAFNGSLAQFSNETTGVYNKTGGTTTVDIAFVNAGTVNVQAGTLALNAGGSSPVGAVFNVSSGATLTFTGGAFTVADGSGLTGPGTVSVAGGTVTLGGQVAAPVFQLNGGTLAGTHTLQGSVTWTNGNLNDSGTTTTIGNSASLTITSAAAHDFNAHAIVNQGTTTWSAGAGELRSGNGGAFTNQGVFNDAASSNMNNAYSGTSATFINASSGQYSKTAGTTTFNVPFTNNGTINATDGTLVLQGGGTIGNGASFLGTGQVQLVSGTFTANGNLTSTSLIIAGGTLVGNFTLSGTLTFISGTLNDASTGTIGNGATLTYNAASPFDFNSRTIVNNGTVNWEVGAGALRSGNGGAFTNNGLFNDAAAGTSTAAVDVNNAFNGTACVFTNSAGAIYRKTSPGTTTMSTSFVNNGQLDLQAGTLALLATSTFNAGATQTGSGLLKLVSGTLTANGAMAFSNFQIAGGTITGNHTFNGTIEWTNGNFNSSASTTTLGGTLTIDSAADHDFDTHAFVNNGTVYWVAGAGPLRSGNSGTFTNNATFNDAASAGWNNAFNGSLAQFSNETTGVYNKTGGTTTVDIAFVNAGTVNVQAGTLNFQNTFTSTGGNLTLTNNATVQFGYAVDLGTTSLAGNGTVIGNIITDGDVSPGTSAGQLNITGNLTLQPLSVAIFELGGTLQGTEYDYLNVSGSVTLGGALEVKFANGFQDIILPNANTFTILSAGALSGSFSNVASDSRLSTSDGFGSFLVTYSGLNVSLSGFTPVPEPSTWALLGVGTSLLYVVSRRRLQRN